MKKKKKIRIVKKEVHKNCIFGVLESKNKISVATLNFIVNRVFDKT